MIASRLGAAVVLCAAAACGEEHAVDTLPYYRTAERTPEWLSSAEASSDGMHRVGAFEFVNQFGDTVTEASFDGRIIVANFFFTQCVGICPATRAQLARVRSAFEGDDRLTLLSHSVTPDLDSPAQLDAWASAHRIAGEGWQLLTGSRDELERLAEEAYFVNIGDGSAHGVASIAHTESVIVLDTGRRIRGVYNGTLAMDVNRMIEDLGILLATVEPVS